MTESPRVIAYDFRIRLDAAEPLWGAWDAERRRVYLLRDDVRRPLSADSYVWPEALDDSAWDEYPLDDPPGENVVAWKDRVRLNALMRTHARTGGVLVAITEHCDVPHRGTACPASVPSSAEFLGFDILDECNLSVLMNHGRGDDPEPARGKWDARWAPHLNDHHLLSDFDVAAEFGSTAKVDDLATTGGDGHGEFCIVGLWALGPLRSG